MTKRLDAKVTMITGTGGQQGRAAALLFAAEGAQVVGCDLNAAASAETTAMVRDAGGEMVSLEPVDLADSAAVESWIKLAIDECGVIDVLYNNASAARMSPITAMSLDDWQFTMRNELDLLFVTTKAVWPHLVKSQGVIINTASIAGLRGTLAGVDTAHAATKGGVIAFTRELCAQGAAHGIRANSISPGAIIPAEMLTLLDAPVPEGQPDIGAVVREQIRRTPAGRTGTGADIATVALFLACDDSAYVNGADIVVDGGFTAVI